MIKNGNTSNGQGYQIRKVQMCLFIYKIEESLNNRPHQVYSKVNSILVDKRAYPVQRAPALCTLLYNIKKHLLNTRIQDVQATTFCWEKICIGYSHKLKNENDRPHMQRLIPG